MSYSLSELEELQFTGTDASLRISLAEYGLAYSEQDPCSNGDLRFVYGVRTNSAGEYVAFDWADFKTDLDFWNEFNWADQESFLSASGLDVEEFDALPLAVRIMDLNHYYGYENVFGTSYSGGFKIVGLED